MHGRYLIRPATLDDDPEAVRALLEPVDFLDDAMPEEIIDRMRTGWQLPPQFGTANLLLAQQHPEGPILGLAHAIPPVQWLMDMEGALGRQRCLSLCRVLVELEAVSVAEGARGQGAPLVLQVPVGRIQWPADASMRHLVRPLVPQVSYRAGVLNGLLAGPSS